MSPNYESIKEYCKAAIEASNQSGNLLSIKSFMKGYRPLLRDEKELKFYKYCRPSKRAIKNLKRDILVCSNPAEFNDIYEGMVSSSTVSPSEVQTIIREFCNAVSISCFSERWDNLLMYAHYTDSFKGFCIEYDFSHIQREFSYLHFFPVTYQPKPSSLDHLIQLKQDIDCTRDAIHNKKLAIAKLDGIIPYFIQKADIWSYEQEWRFIIPLSQFGNYFQTNNLSSHWHIIRNFDYISAIYLAPNIDLEYMKRICKIVKKKNEKRRKLGLKKPIIIYKTRISESSYKMTAEELDFQNLPDTI